MNAPITALNTKKTLTGLAMASALALSLFAAPAAGALSLAGVVPGDGATVELVEGETLKLVVTANLEDGEELRELEVDHSYDNTNPLFPEFSVYADETDPYNNQWATPVETGQEAIFTSLGASVTYSASANQWVLDFGTAITDIILEDGGDVTFHFVLRGVNTDTEAAISWGSMDPTTAENTFNYTLVRVEPDDEEAPGVPNTASADSRGGNLMAAIVVGSTALVVAGAATVRRFART